MSRKALRRGGLARVRRAPSARRAQPGRRQVASRLSNAAPDPSPPRFVAWVPSPPRFVVWVPSPPRFVVWVPSPPRFVVWVPSPDEFSRLGDGPELAELDIGDRLLDLFDGVHDEGTVLHDRLGNRF